MHSSHPRIAILGGGNIGMSLARGLVRAGHSHPGDIIITRRSKAASMDIAKEGFRATESNQEAVGNSDLIVLAVLPQQLDGVLDDIRESIREANHLLVSVVSGVGTNDILAHLGKKVEIVRAMPNTAIAIGQSMTCISSGNARRENLAIVKSMFDTVGVTIEINEELITSATALCACGIAFFLRAIRAASQGGIEIGFHSDEALTLAAQTAKGAASLILATHNHPEGEIDKVTSPKGCTIAGLNEMEHQGFSSALIKGIKTSASKADELYRRRSD